MRNSLNNDYDMDYYEAIIYVIEAALTNWESQQRQDEDEDEAIIAVKCLQFRTILQLFRYDDALYSHVAYSGHVLPFSILHFVQSFFVF